MKKKQDVVAVFDIGKTNKKLLLFNDDYELVMEESISFAEITDEDGFPCEDVDLLTTWILRHVQLLETSKSYQLKAINFTTYGASLVYVDVHGKRISPLYNYLKPYPDDLLSKFLESHGNNGDISIETSSPVMGHLNAGLQLYWFKHKRPELYKKLATILHFPQYLSYQLTGKRFAEMTNVGCHSLMWEFNKGKYHSWLNAEGIMPYLMPVIQGDQAVTITNENNDQVAIGIGLHDSSAAIVPYQLSFKDPFVIVSTGTWTISLNPFNKELPNKHELQHGCLSYQTFDGNPIKVSMLFAGHDHDQQMQRIADHFNVNTEYFKSLTYDDTWMQIINETVNIETLVGNNENGKSPTDPCVFHLRNLNTFQSAPHAYHQLVKDIISRQVNATHFVLNVDSVKNLYVDGGFSRNSIYMQLLSDAFPERNVFSTFMTQGTALGAALAIHHQWNRKEIPSTLINLKSWPKSSS